MVGVGVEEEDEVGKAEEDVLADGTELLVEVLVQVTGGTHVDELIQVGAGVHACCMGVGEERTALAVPSVEGEAPCPCSSNFATQV